MHDNNTSAVEYVLVGLAIGAVLVAIFSFPFL